MTEAWVLAYDFGWEHLETEGTFDSVEAAKRHAESEDGPEGFEWEDRHGVWHGTAPGSSRLWIIRRARDGEKVKP